MPFFSRILISNSILYIQIQAAIKEDTCRHLLFAHAFTGCDTTCRPHGLGKIAILQKIQKNPILAQQADVFYGNNASHEDVIAAGNMALCLLSGGKVGESLNALRYRQYKSKVQIMHFRSNSDISRPG